MFGFWKKLFNAKTTEILKPVYQAEARLHHYIFAHEALRDLMFDNDGLALKLHTEGGQQMLLSLWEKVGQRAIERGTGEMLSPEGLEAFTDEFKTAKDHVAFITIVRLPEPMGVTEAYYVGLIARPMLGGPRQITLRYFTLEVGFRTGEPRTVIGEWDEEGIHHYHGNGPFPDPEAFAEAIWQLYSKD
ncbi:MAG: hypothetical protein QM758_10280 [Armatimonas sp.]